MKTCCVSKRYSISEVMESFKMNKERVAVVLSDSEKVIGVVSQGDIIKALVSGCDIHANVCQIIKPSFLYLNSKDMEKAYKIFRDLKITMLPIVDENFKLVDVITLDSVYDYLEKRNSIALAVR